MVEDTLRRGNKSGRIAYLKNQKIQNLLHALVDSKFLSMIGHHVDCPGAPPIETLRKLFKDNLDLALVEQQVKMSEADYHSAVLAKTLPMRENSKHDFLNALSWVAFPSSKKYLSAQFHATSPNVSKNKRHACKHFDENGLVVYSHDLKFLEYLQNGSWEDVNRCVEHVDSLFQIAVFGHGLLEKLFWPYHGITGHAMLFLGKKLPAKKGLACWDESIDSDVETALTSLDRVDALCPIPLEIFAPILLGSSRRTPIHDLGVFRPRHHPRGEVFVAN